MPTRDEIRNTGAVIGVVIGVGAFGLFNPVTPFAVGFFADIGEYFGGRIAKCCISDDDPTHRAGGAGRQTEPVTTQETANANVSHQDKLRRQVRQIQTGNYSQADNPQAMFPPNSGYVQDVGSPPSTRITSPANSA